MLAELGRGVVGGLSALLLAGSVAILGWALASRWLPGPVRISVRWSAVALVALSFLTFSFWLLALTGFFRLAVLVPWCLVSAVLAWRAAAGEGHPRARLQNDLRELAAGVRAVFQGLAGWTLAAVLMVAGVVLLRGLVAPPLGWDGLAYHLFKAGRVVGSGGLVSLLAPDDWEVYEFIPWGGDLFWSFALVPFPSGLLIAIVGTGLWGIALLGLYAAARDLGANTRCATLAATAIGAMPAAVDLTATAHIDNATWMFFGLGALFVLRGLGGGAQEAPLACAALGCMVGVRVTTGPILVVGAVILGVVLFHAARRPRGGSRVGALLLLCVAGFSLGVPSYWLAWLHKGSPLFPLTVEVGGITLSAGSQVLRDGEAWMLKHWSLQEHQFWPLLLWSRSAIGTFINPGPGALLLVAVGAWGSWSLVRRRQWAVLLWLLVSVLVTFGPVATEGMVTFRRTAWAQQIGRMILPGFAALALLAVAVADRWQKRWVEAGLLAASWLGVIWAWPRGFSLVELPGLGLAAAVGVVALLLLRRIAAACRRGLALRWAWGARVAVVVGLLVALDAVRATQRYPIYEDASVGFASIFHGQPLEPRFVSAWPVWQALDRAEPLRLAVVTGWDDMGQNNYRFPLLGSRLQNRLIYIPATADGSIAHSAHVTLGTVATNYHAWVERLRAAEVDYVVHLLPGVSLEAQWMDKAPELFERELVAPDGVSAIYRFRREGGAAIQATGSATPASGTRDSNTPAAERPAPGRGRPG